MPLIAYNLFQQLDLIHAVVPVFIERCIQGISADAERCRAQVEGHFGLAVALAPHLGYEAATEVAREAARSGRSVRDVILERGLLSEEELEIVMAPEEMTRPGIPGEKKLKERRRSPQDSEEV